MASLSIYSAMSFSQTLERVTHSDYHQISYTETNCDNTERVLHITHGELADNFIYVACPDTAEITVPADVAVSFDEAHATLHVFSQDVVLPQGQNIRVTFENNKGQKNQFLFQYN